jgi:phenylpropionate dioxygenase-like ring-hydroxylating dioxygenase large terminal subunit
MNAAIPQSHGPAHSAGARAWPAEGGARAPYWAFSDPDIYQREQERIFRGPVWHYLGVDAEVPEPGCYKTTRIGDSPVILMRDGDGALRAAVNRCAHRGNLVCREPFGKADELYCVYHAWVYDLQGNLKSAAFRRGIRGEGGLPADFRAEDHGLRKLKVDNFCGLVFGSFASELEPLADWLGEAGDGIRRVLRKPLRVLGYDTQRIAANWKQYHENPRDSYHANILHAFYGTFGLSRQSQESGMIISSNGRHQYFYTKAGTEKETPDYAETASTLKSHNAAFKLEDRSLLHWVNEFGDGVSVQILSLYPTFNLHQISNSIATRQLITNGPDQTDLVWTYLGFADDTESMTELRLWQTNMVGSAGLVSMEDASVCQMIRRATAGSADAASFMEMGGKDLTSGGGTKLSERGLRNFWNAYKNDLGL